MKVTESVWFEPAFNTVASDSTTQGALLLFKIPGENLENRPLEFLIEGKSGEARRNCMEKSFCAEAADPGKCEANLEERAARRRAKREQDNKPAK